MSCHALALLFASVGCNEGPSGGHAAMVPLEASYPFYQDGQLLDPSGWAGARSSAERMATSEAVSSLHVREVIIAANDDTDDDTDTLQSFASDLPVLLAWGASPPPSVPWVSGYRESAEDEFDYIQPSFGEPVAALNVARYLSELAHAIRDDGFGRDENAQELADALLNIGYGVFRSSDTLGTASGRLRIMASAWRAAFEIKVRAAEAAGNDADAAHWRRMSEDLEAFNRSFTRHRLEQLE